MRLTGGQMAQEHIRCHPAFLVEVMQGGDTRRHQGTIQHNRLTWHHQCWSSTGRYLRTSPLPACSQPGFLWAWTCEQGAAEGKEKTSSLPALQTPAQDFPAASCPWHLERSRRQPKGKTKEPSPNTLGQLCAGMRGKTLAGSSPLPICSTEGTGRGNRAWDLITIIVLTQSWNCSEHAELMGVGRHPK